MAGLLKRFLRELPEPVIPWGLHDDLARALHGRSWPGRGHKGRQSGRMLGYSGVDRWSNSID